MTCEIIFWVEDAIEGGYSAKALNANIVTQAETLDQLKSILRDAVRCHFDSENLPTLIRLHYVREDIITLS